MSKRNCSINANRWLERQGQGTGDPTTPGSGSVFPVYSYLIAYRPGTDPLQILAIIRSAPDVQKALRKTGFLIPSIADSRRTGFWQCGDASASTLVLMYTDVITAISLPDALLENAKQYAAERRTTVRALLEDALRRRLALHTPSRFRLHTVRGKPVNPNLDLDRTSHLVELDDRARFKHK